MRDLLFWIVGLGRSCELNAGADEGRLMGSNWVYRMTISFDNKFCGVNVGGVKEGMNENGVSLSQ